MVGLDSLRPDRLVLRPSLPSLLVFVLVSSVTVALSSGAYLYFNRPTTVRIAVGPRDSQLVNYVQAIASALEDADEGFRVRIVHSSGSVQSSELLDEGEADFAVLRSDDETSQLARAVFVGCGGSNTRVEGGDRRLSRCPGSSVRP